MKLVQKILSHGLLIAFFVAVFFLYLYRETLFPQWFGTESQSVAQQTESKHQQQQTQQESTAPAPARPAAQQAGAPEDNEPAVGDTADLPPLASAGTPTSTEEDDSLPPLAGTAAPPSTAPPELPDDAGLSEPADSQAAPGDFASDLPPTVGEATSSAGADRDMPAQYQAAEQAAAHASTDVAATASDTAQRHSGVGAVATPASPQYRPVEPPASSEPAAVDVAQQTATTPPTEPPGPAAAQAPPAVMQAPAGQTGQAAADGQLVAGSDRAPPQYRPLQQPRKYPSAPDIAPQVPQRGEAPPVAPPPSPAATVASAPPAAGGQGFTDADAGFRTAIAQARETFWNRDMRGAVQAYSDLVENYPAQADGWGELGNLYLTLNQRSVAVDAYYKAIGLLIDQGDTIRARHLLRMLHGLDSGKASELEQRLRKVGS